MTKLLDLFSAEFGPGDRGMPKHVVPSLDLALLDNREQVPQLPPVLSYKDVIDKSGMSWSNMLRETSKVEFRFLSSYAQERPAPNNTRQVTELPPVSTKRAPYQWTRTEDLERKIFATDRPYRSTYGDGNCSPSRLYLSTDLPILAPTSQTPRRKASGGLDSDRAAVNRQITKIYGLLHSGDCAELSKVHILTRRGANKNLPTVLPHFQVQLSRSIRQVFDEGQASNKPETLFTKRPMTSEKIIYRPITEQSINPDLIISKTGKVEFRERNAIRHLQHRRDNESKNKPIAQTKSRKELVGQGESGKGLTHSKLTQMELDNSIPSKKQAASKTNISAGVSSLQSAEGFQFTVKITPKNHPSQ